MMRVNLKLSWMKVVGVICAFAILFGGGYLVLRQWESQEVLPAAGSSHEDTDKPLVYLDGQAYQLREDLTTLLFLGIDNEGEMVSSGSYLNDGQSDVVTLLVLNETENRYTLLHLNRDTMTPVQRLAVSGQELGTQVMQLALAHTYGDGMERSCENTVDAVEELLYGVPVDHYLALNMTGLSKLVDAMGGLTVTIRGDFSQVDSTLVEGSRMTLDGAQCLTYLRGRYQVGDQTNQERQDRQRQFLQELLNRGESDYAASLLVEVSDYMLTDLNASRLEALAERLGEAEFAEIISPEGEAAAGREYMEFYVDETALRELVVKVFYEPAEEGVA